MSIYGVASRHAVEGNSFMKPFIYNQLAESDNPFLISCKGIVSKTNSFSAIVVD
jgi:hypothetical protein